jgi:4-amino-4-deoxy-L-arabinose transferase-like glycosyltransferase
MFFKRIEFFILLYFLIRLYGITDPPLEVAHHWRQVTGLMVARNFLEVDNNIFFPRVDENNGGTGIIGMEFPIMNYLHYLLSLIFGYQHWYGRIINLIFSSIGIYFFYIFFKKCFNEFVAKVATLSLLGSTWFVFSRKFMPDTFCMSLLFIALYFAYQYLEKQKVMYLLFFFIISTVACLAKIPAVTGLSLVIFLWWKFKTKLRIIVFQTVFIIASLLIVFWWYFIWNPFLSQTYGNWYNSGQNFTEGLQEILSNLSQVFTNFSFHSFNSFILFLFSMAGLFYVIIKKEINSLIISVLYFGAFLLYAVKSGHYFVHHNYYMIPLIPLMAFWVGWGIGLIQNKKLQKFILFLGLIESFANQQHDFYIKVEEYEKLKLEAIFDKFSKRTDLIAVNGNKNPQLLYFTHRKGWNLDNKDFKNQNLLNDIKVKGCKYILIQKSEEINNLEIGKIIFENHFFVIYEL